MRILITGSRDMTDYGRMAHAISAAIVDLHEKVLADKEVVIVHGAARGADTLSGDYVSQAKEYLRGKGIKIYEERHPADWSAYGKGAGPRRNQEMVDLGADVCLAFLAADSRGTRDCLSRAQHAGIPVVVYNV